MASIGYERSSEFVKITIDDKIIKETQKLITVMTTLMHIVLTHFALLQVLMVLFLMFVI